MYKDVDAVVDAPAFFFWEEIHKAHPDAKVKIFKFDLLISVIEAVAPNKQLHQSD